MFPGLDGFEKSCHMKIQILGCHGSDMLLKGQNGTSSYRSCGFLVDDHLLIDAGTAPSVLTLDAQHQIRHVLLSHLHMDHVKELPALVDNLFGLQAFPLKVWSTADILDGLKRHVFNDHVFPDFFALPSIEKPTVLNATLPLGSPTTISSYRVTPIAVNHTVSTVGFLVEDNHTAFLYSGDTYETEAIWVAASRLPHLEAVFIEASFPNGMSDLAQESKHLTPWLLAQEFKKIGRPNLRVYVYHLKPQYQAQIIPQLVELGIPNLSVLEEGQEIVLSTKDEGEG